VLILLTIYMLNNPILGKLTKIAEGGNREVLTREGSNLAIKTYVVESIELQDLDFENKKKIYLEDLKQKQEVIKSLFGKMYIPARFLNFAIKNGKCHLVSHEPLRLDLYPSEEFENVTNLTFLGYFGMTNGDIDARNMQFILGALLGENKQNYISDYGREGVNILIQTLQDPKAQTAIKDYLNKLSEYTKTNYRLDLVGKDNVVLEKNQENEFQVIINNSAAKFEKIDTFLPNLKKILKGDYGRMEIIEICNQIAVMVNTNLLCDLVGNTRIFNFDKEAESLIKFTLLLWDNLYLKK
jgi:hypothetical protein